jgi:transcriptional regulator with XRE-family HTH domain
VETRFGIAAVVAQILSVAPRRNTADRDALPSILRAARKRIGLTQTELARVLQRPQSYVSKYERGELRIDILELRQICKAIGISLATVVRHLEAMLRD